MHLPNKRKGETMIEEEREHKYRAQNGETPGFKAFHEVHITKDLGSERNEKVIAFIDEQIGEFKGHIEDKHGIPLMLFERKQDAQIFAKELTEKLKIEKEHITVKARKYTR
jgi:hypothetical protein